jgi:hypothetical protein
VTATISFRCSCSIRRDAPPASTYNHTNQATKQPTKASSHARESQSDRQPKRCTLRICASLRTDTL